MSSLTKGCASGFGSHSSFISFLPAHVFSPSFRHTLSTSAKSLCSTCLSELGWDWHTLPSTRGGPCLLSINNPWNSEIQVGPVSGRQYHTPEGGLTSVSLTLSLSLSLFLAPSLPPSLSLPLPLLTVFSVGFFVLPPLSQDRLSVYFAHSHG